MINSDATNIPLLIGSAALNFHRPIGRVPADIDLLVHEDNIPDKRTRWELTPVSTESDHRIMAMEASNDDIIDLEGVTVRVASIEALKALKMASEGLLGKAKHSWDLVLLKDVVLSEEWKEIASLRRDEIKDRLAGNKDKFFNKFEIFRVVEHDSLHAMINEDPLYKLIIEDDGTTPNREKFDELDHDVQVDLVREECFVLALERNFIPKAAKNWPLVKILSHLFKSWNKTTDPGYRWLSRLSTEGAVVDNPDWISKFCLDNHEAIVDNISGWWSERCDRLPKSLFEEIKKCV